MNNWLRLGVVLASLHSAQAAWHQVFIPADSKQDLMEIKAALGEFDPCGTVITEAGVEIPVDDEDLGRLFNAGLSPQMLVQDLEQFYADRLGFDRNYGAYHTYSEGMAEIQQLHADFPTLVSAPISIGTTVQGNTIWALKISDNPEVDEDEPEVLYGAYIHAREAITIEVLLHFMHHLTDNYGTDSRITDIVNGRELWFIPFMNPDGVLYNESTNPNGGGMWRKNRRNNGGSYGVDLNRNFPYQWGYDNSGSSPYAGDETYRGPSAGSELETQAIRTFINAHTFTAALSYHSYSNLLIYPWGYADLHVAEPDYSTYLLMASEMSAINGYSTGTAWELLYNTNGDTVDWSHGATGEHARIMAITPEVGNSGDGFWPAESRIPALVAENLEPNLLWAEWAGNPWTSQPPVPPTMAELGEVGANYTLSWNTPSPDPVNPAVAYDLHELSGLTQGLDLFANTNNWIPGGVSFVLSNTRSYSPPSSYYGGTGNSRNAISRLSTGLQVLAGMQISLRAWYDIESNWDYAYVEVSTNGTTWNSLVGNITTATNPNGTNDGNGITGSSAGSFVLGTFPLTAFVGQNIQVRLRYETDGGVLGAGIYVDDFSPVQSFASETTLATNLPSTTWDVVNQSTGTWFYKVRARDAEGDQSSWSNLIEVVSSGGGDSTPPIIVHGGLTDTMDSAGPWTVTAQITDFSGVAWASLEHRFNGGGWALLAMTNAGAGFWTADIPGPLSPGTLVEYRISAADGSESANEALSQIWAYHILAPVGLEYCQAFESGLNDFSVINHLPAGTTWGPGTLSGHGGTAYIQYGSTSQEDHASLLSPVFDCSAQGTVALSFYHQLKMGYSSYWTDAWVRGSLDGGLTWPYLLGEWHALPADPEVTIEGVQVLDLSSWAALQPQVRVKFEYHDLYDWFWHVDDVCVTGTLAIAPDPVQIDIAMLGSDATLSWQSSAGATSYRVYASSSAREGFVQVAQVAGTNWTDTGALSQTQRFYQVRAATALRTTALPGEILTLDPEQGRRLTPSVTKHVE